MVIDLSGWGEPKAQRDKISIISRAVTEKKLLTFRYRNLRGEELIRTIEPMTLILKMNYWYMYGYCRDRDDFRLFRVSRMFDCALLDTTFVKKDKVFDEKEFFNNQTNILKIRLKFSHRAKSKVEEFFADHYMETLPDGSIIVEVDYPEDEWVYSTLLSYGDTVEVLSPPHLRQLIKEKLKKAYNLYKT
jgi:predicted DNA-binding transcriptional regulator YafY